MLLTQKPKFRKHEAQNVTTSRNSKGSVNDCAPCPPWPAFPFGVMMAEKSDCAADCDLCIVLDAGCDWTGLTCGEEETTVL
jgi:hypothetical protein